MCPQSCDAQNEGGEEPTVRTLKRDHRGKVSVPEFRSSRGQVVRRPVARYRRSVVIDTGASGSVDEPIIVHDDRHGKQTEIIDLEADLEPVGAPAPGLPTFLQRVEAEEPPGKRVCKGGESEAVTSPVRPGRQHGFLRASGRPWARERSRQGSSSGSSSAAADARRVAPADVLQGGNQQEDERMARDLQQEFSSASNDADLARALQDEENRRVFRPPPPVAIDHSRFHLYMRQLDRHRMLQASQIQQQQAQAQASSSRQQQQQQQLQQQLQGEAPRNRNRVLEGNGRRIRALQERLSAFGALLHRQIPLAMQLSYVDRDFNENDYEMLLSLDDGVQQRGASQTKINELPVTEHEDATGQSEACSICLEVPESGERMRRLPCMHSFHQNCIDTWLQRRGNCPVCKAAI